MYDMHRKDQCNPNAASSCLQDRILRCLENSTQKSKAMSCDKKHIIHNGDEEKKCQIGRKKGILKSIVHKLNRLYISQGFPSWVTRAYMPTCQSKSVTF